jgi:hypothetical protein
MAYKAGTSTIVSMGPKVRPAMIVSASPTQGASPASSSNQFLDGFRNDAGVAPRRAVYSGRRLIDLPTAWLHNGRGRCRVRD